MCEETGCHEGMCSQPRLSGSRRTGRCSTEREVHREDRASRDRVPCRRQLAHPRDPSAMTIAIGWHCGYVPGRSSAPQPPGSDRQPPEGSRSQVLCPGVLLVQAQLGRPKMTPVLLRHGPRCLPLSEQVLGLSTSPKWGMCGYQAMSTLRAARDFPFRESSDTAAAPLDGAVAACLTRAAYGHGHRPADGAAYRRARRPGLRPRSGGAARLDVRRRPRTNRRETGRRAASSGQNRRKLVPS
jgi:hypothetical protein